MQYPSRVILNVLSGTVYAIMVAACNDAAPTAPEEEPIPPAPPNAVYPLSLETYDGSGEAVHPDAVETPAGWGAAQTYLAVTPYPGGNATYENPSFYERRSFADWRPPVGAINPLVTPGKSAYLSDPDQVFDPVSNQIWLYYRRVSSHNEIWLVRSRDGVMWDTPIEVFRVPNHSAISPAVVRKSNHDWMMWTVNAGASGCGASQAKVELRRSQDGIRWSDPVDVDLPSVTTGESPWHIDVTWIPERREFWALFNVKQASSCTTQKLQFAKSTDGRHWTTAPEPLLTKGAIPEFADVVYRSALTYDAAHDKVTIWYSGAHVKSGSGRYSWHIATQSMSRETLFGIVSGAISNPVMHEYRTRQSLSSKPSSERVPLTNETAP